MRTLDPLDHQLIQLLTQNGRASNRSLGLMTGVTEATVAIRLRRLTEDGIMAISCVFDRKVSGYQAYGHIMIEVAGRAVAEVAEDIKHLKGVTGIGHTFGSTDLMVTVMGTDSSALFAMSHETIGKVPGVSSVSTYLEMECLRYSWGPASRMAEVFYPEFPDLQLEFDDVDRSLVDLLIQNGRQSNREIGRTLGVSEGTVRLRLRRLDAAGFMRIVARTDFTKAGLTSATAHLGINATGFAGAQVMQFLLRHPYVIYASTNFGPHNFLIIISAPDRDALVRLITEELRAIQGVKDVEVWELIESFYHVYNWVRLDAPLMSALSNDRGSS